MFIAWPPGRAGRQQAARRPAWPPRPAAEHLARSPRLQGPPRPQGRRQAAPRLPGCNSCAPFGASPSAWPPRDCRYAMTTRIS